MADIFDADFLRGFQLGKAFYANLLRAAKGEPVAYLYNGVRLPKLPDVDKETYPQAYIFSTPSGSYYLWVCAGFSVRTAEDFYADAPCKLYRIADGSWDLVGEYDVSQSHNYSMNPFWASADIPAYDGSVYLAASDPIPVYE